MKMAKASNVDMNNVVDFLPVADSILQDRQFPADHEREWESIHGHEAEALDILAEAYESASMSRVIWGYQTLINPANKVVDPKANVLELHPDIRQAMATTVLHPADEYHEDFGPVLWWWVQKGADAPNDPPAYIGSPLDSNWDRHAEYTHFSVIPQVSVKEQS